MEIRVEDDTDIVRDGLGQIISKVPEMEEELSEEMMEIAVEELEKSFRRNFDNFTGDTQRKISMDNVKPAPATEGTALRLPLGGDTNRGANFIEWNEYADEGHWVSIDRDNEPIYSWAQQNFAEIPDSIKVTPTPFIKPAIKRMRRKMRQKAEGPDNAVERFADELDEVN